MSSETTQAQIILEYFMAHPKRDIPHAEVVDWAVAEYKKRTGEVFRDPDRQVRKFAQEGKLIKVAKGVYKYDPDAVIERELFDFTPEQKRQILERDGYRCVVCGRGPADGVDLQVDHIKPKDQGGENTIENGETLCGQHNFIKKNYSQREAYKRYVLKMLEQAKVVGDENGINFCKDILAVYDKYGFDDHIKN